MAMRLNTPVTDLVLTPADKEKLTPAAAMLSLGDLLQLSSTRKANPHTLNLTVKDLSSLDAAFADQIDNLDPGVAKPQDVNCCCCAPCCCSSAAAMPPSEHTA